jgi:hypothetical protein
MIPNRVFFIWFGKELPWTTGLAMLSVKQVQNPEEIVLYVDSEISGDGYDLIKGVPGIELKKIEDSLFCGLNDNGLIGNLFHNFKKLASKSDLLRYVLVYKFGGVYLDADTIAVKSWNDLLQYKGFCGLEAVTFPGDMYSSSNPIPYLLAGIRYLWRLLCARLPQGWRLFRPTEKLFRHCVNEAILGSEPGNKIVESFFTKISELKEKDFSMPACVGPHIVQKATGNKSSENMEALPSAYFYPLGPDISLQYFRKGSAKMLNKILYPQTRIVHWYNNVEKKYLHQELNQKWIEQNSTSAFAELARNVIDSSKTQLFP